MTRIEDRQATAFDVERPHLLAVAFRILGTDADAQDVVQEAWVRYARTNTTDVKNLQAWLTTVVTRLCVDLLRRTRESPWDADDLAKTPLAGGGPEEIAVLAAELTAAFVVALDRLSPEQRVALVLHDVFGTPFDEVARILATSTSSARKLASRARVRLRAEKPDARQKTDDTARKVVDAFLTAARDGDVDGLVAILHPDVTRTADPQALPTGSPQFTAGIEAVLAETRQLQAYARAARSVSIDGRPGIVVEIDGTVAAVLIVQVAEGQVHHYDVVADPLRLERLQIEGGPQ